MKIFKVLPLLLVLIACKSDPKTEATAFKTKADKFSFEKIELNYATKFKVSYLGDAKLVEVPEPFKGASRGHKYLLVQRGAPIPEHDDETKVIHIPVEKIVCTSTTHLAFLDMLDLADKLVGFPSTKYISSPAINARIKEGKVEELGMDQGLNMEVLTALSPDIVWAYTLSGDYDQFEQLERVGIPSVMSSAYLEPTPLGRAEWVKFTALFFNKEHEANEIFNGINTRYEQLKAAVDAIKTKLTVFSGSVYKDIWYMPGGNSWAGKLLQHAGGDFLWKGNEDTGSQALSFEAVYDKAIDADIWVGTADYRGLDDLAGDDSRYADFAAFKKGNVYTHNAKMTENGGNDYFETGSARPDIVLKDLVKILHPNLLPDYSLYFYRKLDEQKE